LGYLELRGTRARSQQRGNAEQFDLILIGEVPLEVGRVFEERYERPRDG
jgi:hypothetical protein